jgi:Type II secretion system (T2SS), protein F
VLPVALLLARAVAALAQALVGWTALLLVPFIWVFVVRRYYRWCNQQRLKSLYEQFPDVLAMLVRAVRVGIPIVEGIRSVARESPHPTDQEFGIVVDQMVVGVRLEEALHALAERNQLPEYRFFATALALQSETGGAVSETLELLAEVIRKRVALRAHAHALVIQNSGGLLKPEHLQFSARSYANFADANADIRGADGPGTSGQIVRYTFNYTQAYLTPIAIAIAGAPQLVHSLTVTVVNEPFPSV